MIKFNKLPDHDGVLYLTHISSQGKKLAVDKEVTVSTEGFHWLHMCALTPQTRHWMEQETNIDHVVIDAMLAEDTRPRTLVRGDGVLVIVRAMNQQGKEHSEDMISLRIWIDRYRIITTRRRDILAVEDVKCFIEKDQGPKNTGDFLTMITERVYARMEPVVEYLDECVSIAEENFIVGSEDGLQHSAAVIRRRNAIFRRHITPQKLLLETLLKSEISWLSEDDKESLVESHDKVTRYVESLNDIRERTQILNEEIRYQQGEKLNSTTYLFSVAATIFLPLSFLTGLFGINIGGMPGMDKGAAFAVFVVFCVVIVAIQIMLFRKMKWF